MNSTTTATTSATVAAIVAVTVAATVAVLVDLTVVLAVTGIIVTGCARLPRPRPALLLGLESLGHPRWDTRSRQRAPRGCVQQLPFGRQHPAVTHSVEQGGFDVARHRVSTPRPHRCARTVGRPVVGGGDKGAIRHQPTKANMGGLVLLATRRQPQVTCNGTQTRIRGPGRRRHRHHRRQKHAQRRRATARKGRLPRGVRLCRRAISPHAALQTAAAAAAASERGRNLRFRSPRSLPASATAVGSGRRDATSGGLGGSRVTYLTPSQHLLVVGCRDSAAVAVTVAVAAAVAGKHRVYLLLIQVTVPVWGLALDAGCLNQAAASSPPTNTPLPIRCRRPMPLLVARPAAVLRFTRSPRPIRPIIVRGDVHAQPWTTATGGTEPGRDATAALVGLSRPFLFGQFRHPQPPLLGGRARSVFVAGRRQDKVSFRQGRHPQLPPPDGRGVPFNATCCRDGSIIRFGQRGHPQSPPGRGRARRDRRRHPRVYPRVGAREAYGGGLLPHRQPAAARVGRCRRRRSGGGHRGWRRQRAAKAGFDDRWGRRRGRPRRAEHEPQYPRQRRRLRSDQRLLGRGRCAPSTTGSSGRRWRFPAQTDMSAGGGSGRRTLPPPPATASIPVDGRRPRAWHGAPAQARPTCATGLPLAQQHRL